MQATHQNGGPHRDHSTGSEYGLYSDLEPSTAGNGLMAPHLPTQMAQADFDFASGMLGSGLLTDPSPYGFDVFADSGLDGRYLDPHFNMLSLEADPAMAYVADGFDTSTMLDPLKRRDTGGSQRTTIAATEPMPRTAEHANEAAIDGTSGVVDAGPVQSSGLASPMIKVQDFEGIHTGMLTPTQTISRQQSDLHLSPFQEGGSQFQVPMPATGSGLGIPTVDSVKRRDDGSWSADLAGQRGIPPQIRGTMGDLEVPTLDEIQEARQRAEKNAGVEDWLDHSDVGSDRPGRRSGPSSRPRAQSTNNMARNQYDQAVSVPGPGVYVEVPSDLEDASSCSSSSPQSPPAEVHIDAGESYFADASNTSLRSAPAPWGEKDPRERDPATRYQPPTSNAAMMRFRARVQDVESASLAATLGSSRRMSDSTLASVMTAKGLSADLTSVSQANAGTDKKHQRRGSFLDSILPKRTNSSQWRRKTSVPSAQPNLIDANSTTGTGASISPSAPKRKGSWNKARSPKLDTDANALQPTLSSPNSLAVQTPTTPWGAAKQAIRRSRSRSELGRIRSKSDAGRSDPGLGELMTQFGGPPVPTLASPMNATGVPQPRNAYSPDLDEDSGEEGGFSAMAGTMMDLNVRNDPIIPTPDGFKSHIRQLNPRIPPFLLERLRQEQLGRFKRLLELKLQHAQAVSKGKCASGSFCFALGGHHKTLKPKLGNKEVDSNFVGFKIMPEGASAEKFDRESDGSIVAAQFPVGVPLPPAEVGMLPAEFECPLCFKVKKFFKPSDWTKHVREDVQPFTCTFPDCNEPKSFKRKADWVRHENEGHRRLESWTCNIGTCTHVCFRKDNFVQHLVREHKIAEPRSGSKKAGPASRVPFAVPGPSELASAVYDHARDDIWAIVDDCRHDTTRQPEDELCRFCDNRCNSWKKLTVHLAKHMEQVSMPILKIVSQRSVKDAADIPDYSLAAYDSAAGHGLSESPQMLATMPAPHPDHLDIGHLRVTQDFTSLTPDIVLNDTSHVMHSYPPAQAYAHSSSGHSSYTSTPVQQMAPTYLMHSYPPPFPQSSNQRGVGTTLVAPGSASAQMGGLPQNYNPTSYPQPTQISRPRDVGTQFGSMSAQSQMYASPVDSSSFTEEAFALGDTPFMLPDGGDGLGHPSFVAGTEGLLEPRQVPVGQHGPDVHQEQHQEHWQDGAQLLHYPGTEQQFF